MKRLFLAAAFPVLLLSPASAQVIGDVVYLKSGGPPMTVTEILPRADLSGVDVGLHWFSGAAMMAGTFPATALVVTDPVSAISKSALEEKCRVFPPKDATLCF